MSAFSRLYDANACLRESEVRRLGSVAWRCDSAAASLRLRCAEVLARAWRARKRAWRSVVVVGGVVSVGGWDGVSVVSVDSFGVGGSESCFGVGGGSVTVASASSGSGVVVATTLRFFDGGILRYRRGVWRDRMPSVSLMTVGEVRCSLKGKSGMERAS